MPFATLAGERVLTIDELAREFGVSTKTVSRWRREGLISCRFQSGGHQRVGFQRSSVNRFVALHEEQVRRAVQSSQSTDAEREQIIDRARCLALAGARLAEITRRIAQETGRSAETIRISLRQFDRRHPDVAIFPDRHRPLSTEMRTQIYRQHCRGESVAALAHRFSQSRTAISRIINAMRAAHIRELPLDCISNEQFSELHSQRKVAEIVGPPPQRVPPLAKSRSPKDVPAYLAALYEVPLLTREQEVQLFQKMNYLKYAANTLRSHFILRQPRSTCMDRIEKLYDESVATKNQIIRANLRLVVSIAKRHVGRAGDFFELVSDGNISLIKAVEKFDLSRGNRFSTYASRAIMKNFARTIPSEFRHRERFCTSCPESFNSVEDMHPNYYEQESTSIYRESCVADLLNSLDPRERQIVTSRYGLTRGQQRLTLEQIGAVEGVSKERIRQIQWRAIGKLRKVAEEDRIEDLLQ
jgi:RNA polymerase primary sigma factor/RNA polymerase sigma factor